MKRDMELIRNLLLGIESSPRKSSWKELIPKEGGEDDERKLALAHLQLLREAGLIKGAQLHLVVKIRQMHPPDLADFERF
jgi:Hypothetical protein (DUF2513)